MIAFADNPPMLPPEVTRVEELRGDWWVGHTKPRCEKAFAFDLLARSIGFYLPMVKKTMVSGGRKRQLMLPVFPSYVFFCGNTESRVAAAHTGRLVNVLPVRLPEKFVGELSTIELALQSLGAVDPFPFAVVGKRCRVVSGPLMGIEGVIARRDERQLLVLEVTMLGCGVSVEIDPALLEPLG
jgi:transcription antitermination factor NusG